MPKPPVPPNEQERLAALRATGLLDTPSEAEFDDIAALAAHICTTPIAFISLVDEHRQWFKSRYGLDVAETSRDVAFCAYAILGREPFVVPDATKDPRFSDNPLVCAGPQFRFYAGVPLVDAGDRALGTLCVLDRAPRELGKKEIDALGALGRQITRLIGARRQSAEVLEMNARLSQTLDSLADSEQRFRLLAEQSSELIIRYAPDGRRVYVSPASRDLLGYEPEELLGQPGFDIVHPDDRALLAAAHMAVLAGESPRTLQYRSRRKDGEYRWFESSGRAIRDSSGVLLEVQGATRDITARKAIDKMKSEFVATVSHELRTPLTSIRGALGLLASGAVGELSGDGAEIVHIAVKSCDRLVRLVNDILDLEKMEAGKLELERRRTRASELVRLGVEAVGAVTLHTHVAFGVRVHADDELDVDVDRIVQVLVNLLSNAVKFSPNGGEVSVEVTRPSEGRLRFAVRDWGPGILPEKVSELFKRFHQLDGSDARPKGGTGLGLAISKAIVEQHGGSIDVESEPGRGTVFAFSLDSVAGR